MCLNHTFENTLNYCSPGHGGWGLVRIAAIIPESHLLFICPSACFRHGALGAIQHGHKNQTSYLYITPEDIITGYDNIIVEGAKELLNLNKQIKVLFLFVSCIDDFIGTDIDSIAKELENKHPNVIVRACHMNPITTDTNKPPLVTTLQSMFSTIITDNYATEDAVNLCGNFTNISSKCELFDFLKDFNISVRQLGDYKTYNDFCEMGRSKYNLILRPEGKFSANYMDNHFKTTSKEYMITYDIDEIRENYIDFRKFLLKNHTNFENRYFNLDLWENETKILIQDTLNKVNKIPIIISSSAVIRPFNLAKALIKYEFNVKEIICQKIIPSDRDSYEYIYKNHEEIKISQALHHKNAIRLNTDKNTLAIGFEAAYLRESDYIVDLSGDEGMYGYYGIKRLMNMISKSLNKKASLKQMIQEYGAVI